ncbi:unnamed protein product, partial [Ectocarpus sp. 12 AP-2014]
VARGRVYCFLTDRRTKRCVYGFFHSRSPTGPNAFDSKRPGETSNRHTITENRRIRLFSNIAFHARQRRAARLYGGRTRENMKANTAAAPFLSTLLEMINRGHCLFDDGNLVFGNAQLFASTVLPRYFKHGNFSSFQRQLYYFSWRKVVSKGGGGKTSPQVFYNRVLKGQDRTKILDLKRKLSAATAGKSATHTTPVSDQQPLSKYSGVDPDDDLAALTKILPPKIVSWTEPSIAQRRSIGGSSDGPSAAGGGGGGRIGSSGYGRSGGRPGGSGESGRLRNGGIPSSFSAGRGGGGGGGKTSLGLNPDNARHSFCGWQSPRGQANGGHRVGGGVGRGSSSAGENVAFGKRQDCRAYGWDRSPTKRRQDGGGSSGRGVDESTSIQNLLTAVQLEIEDRRSTTAELCSETCMPNPLRTPCAARTATIDPPSVPIPDQLPPPPLVAPTIQASLPAVPNNNHSAADPTSLRLVFASSTDALQPLSPPKQVGVNVGTPTRSSPFTSSHDAEVEGKKFGSFDVKNFGDSLLGSGGDGAMDHGDTTREGQGRGSVPSSTDGSTWASSAAQLGNDMVTKSFGSGGGCGGAAAAALLLSFPDPEPGQPRGGVISPNRVLPLTPSPLSLDRPEDRLLGPW